MKKISYLIIVAAAVLCALSACEFKEDNLFDVEPATRQDRWMADYRRVFNNNEYGWALYVSTPTYGRHPSVGVFAVRFEPTMCTFYPSASTRSIPYAAGLDSVQSSYSFKMDNGVVLSFDTYNAFFHYYSDQSQYFAQDLQGDFEFCLDRYSENEDTIFGHGKTKGLPFFMVKMKQPAPDYQTESDHVTDYAAYDCVMICAGDTLPCRFLSGYRNVAVYFADEEDGLVKEHLYSYGNLTNGIYLMENFVYKGVTVVEMQLDFTSGEFTDIHGKAKIGPKPFSDYLCVMEDYDNWFFGYSGLGTWTQGEYEKLRTAMDESGTNYSSKSWVYQCFYPHANGTLDLVFNMWYGADEVTFPLDIKKVDNTHIALRWTGKERSGRSFSFYDMGLKYAVDAIAKQDDWTTYEISSREGNPMNPVGFELTDVSNPDNSIYFEKNFRYYHGSIWE
ncbi:MAG: DUF4302 domain-containing protein [Bacteroidaceae bacterium]|nr:DUF4302 domain-containing protein [Bacteroidaceae bacterium]